MFSNPKARFRRTIPLKDNKETQPANVNIATYNPLEGLEEEYDTEYEDIPEYEEKCTQFTWKQISDPSYVCTMAQIGRPYYWHAITRQSKWECPKVFVRARYPHDYQVCLLPFTSSPPNNFNVFFFSPLTLFQNLLTNKENKTLHGKSLLVKRGNTKRGKESLAQMMNPRMSLGCLGSTTIINRQWHRH